MTGAAGRTKIAAASLATWAKAPPKVFSRKLDLVGLATRGWGATGPGIMVREPLPPSVSVGILAAPMPVAEAGPSKPRLSLAGPVSAVMDAGRPVGMAGADIGFDPVLARQEAVDRILLGLKFVRRGLELVLGPDQGAVEIVIGDLQVGEPVLICGLHLLEAVILGLDDAVLEDHIDGGERDPAQEDQGEAGHGGLQGGAKREELHPPSLRM